MEDGCEAVVIVGEGDAEEGDVRDLGDTGITVGEVDPVDKHEANDLAEGERHDRQIVAAQPQHREAENDAPHRREDPASGRQTQNDRPNVVASSA